MIGHTSPDRAAAPGAVFECLVLAPRGLPEGRVLCAAARAGGLGIVSFAPGPGCAAGAERFGVSVVAAAELTALASAELRPDLVIAPAAVLADAPEAGDALRARGARLFAELIAWDAVADALVGRVDGLVLKGHAAAGLVTEETAFVLLQTARRHTDLPLFVRGGVTPATAAAARVGGAAGVVLDDQILLMAEVELGDPALSRRIASLSGQETLQIEHPEGEVYLRGLDRPGAKSGEALSARIRGAADPRAEMAAIAAEASWAPGSTLMPGGQGLALAGPLARRYATIGRLIGAVRDAVADLPRRAAARRALAEGGPLAGRLGTRYPIVQGPMTRVSDVARFSGAVGAAGALPVSALALLKGPQVERLLTETKAEMAGRPWGVGLLGFAPTEVLKPQFDAVDKIRPDVAIVAGGRINQVTWFESRDIPCFVHAPTAGLLVSHLEDGMRRFIVEGRECGGHIGPLTSFTLWGAVVEALEAHPIVAREGAAIEIVFAGGIHDAVSAAMVATLADPLAAQGVTIGVLMGTGYLFTKEIVDAGAILPDYQEVALACEGTQSLWEGPGFASRCAVTPITEEFRATRRGMEAQGAAVPEIREALEEISLGRLRMATKGLARVGAEKALTEIGAEQRRREGMYMIGQVARLRNEVGTIAELHAEVSAGAVAHLDGFAAEVRPAAVAAPAPTDIAIVGMAALLPGSETLAQYWRRVLSGQSAIEEIPEDRWDLDAYHDPDRAARDRIYARRGGFLHDIPFDPLAYGIPPATLASVDPMQLLALELVSDVLRDAAPVPLTPTERERVSVKLGFSGGPGETGGKYVARSELLGIFGRDVPEEVLAKFPDWTEDSFPGTLPNVTAGRIANRFDFGGTNLVVDAACGSSLAAVYQGVMELESGRADMVIAGGVDTQMTAFGYLCFSKTGALSPRGVCNTFDARADGIVISEGLGAVALKRRADAEAAGDRIYAVIKGVGASSDGRAKGLTAPLPAGQKRALWRAYAQAGYDPGTVGLFEAHGTGTVAGDKAELDTVSSVLAETEAAPRSAAIGSVKALIGHTKATAGVAGLMKVALGLHHRAVPPHALVEAPNPVFEDPETPLYLSQRPRPWVARPGVPRRAGVSAFGFGGTNFHVTLEEHADPVAPAPAIELGADLMPVVLSAPTRAALRARLEGLAPGDGESLPAFAARAARGTASGDPVRAGFVATSRAEAEAQLKALAAHLDDGTACPKGLAFSDAPPLQSGAKLAFLYPGQGAQYPDMLAQTALLAPEMIDRLDRAEEVLAGTPSFAGARLAQKIYPGDAFDRATKTAQMAALTETEIAQPALGVVEAGLTAFLDRLGVAPDMVAGHSYGEFVALHAAGLLGFDDLVRLSEARGRAMVANGDPARPGAMAAVRADRAATEAALKGIEGVTIANLNSPSQTVIAGARAVIEAAEAALSAADLDIRRVPVSQAFHSPLMAAARADFDAALSTVSWGKPALPVYSNTLGRAHDHAIEAVRETMSAHLVSPVDFVAMARAMAADGAGVFVEVGPKSVLSSRIAEILGSEVRTIALDRASGDAATVLAGLVELFTLGAPLAFDTLWSGMAAPEPRRLETAPRQLWRLNGGYVRRDEAPRRNVRVPEAAPLSPPRAALSPSGAQPGPDTTTLQDGLEFMDITPGHPPQDIGADRADVLANFHHMMRDFLRVQENVMLAYLGQAPVGQVGAAPALPAPAVLPLNPVAPPPMMNGAAPAPVPPMPAAPPPPMPAPSPAAAPAPVPDPAPPPAAAPVSVPAAVSAAAPSGDALRASFIALIAEKTGYPEDALDPDQDLEADLGVDSIKRMEILGALQKSLPGAAAEAMRAEMDTIAELATIREIVAFIDGKGGGGGGTAPAPAEGAHPFDVTGEENDRALAGLPRFVQEAFAEPADHVAADWASGLCVVVTETADGFHDHVLAALKAAGAAPLLLPERVSAEAEALTAWVAQARAEGSLGGLVFLGARRSVDWATLDLAAWRAVHGNVTKRLFRLLQALAPDLAAGGRLIVASEMGGLFGRHVEAGSPSRPPAAKGGEIDNIAKGGEIDNIAKGGEIDNIAKGGEIDGTAKGGQADARAEGGKIGAGAEGGKIDGTAKGGKIDDTAKGGQAGATAEGGKIDVGAEGGTVAAANGADESTSDCAGTGAALDGAAGGGTVGLVKALSLEWPACSSKAIDLDPGEPADARALHLVRELSFLPGRREAGYPGGVRTILRTEPRSLAPPMPGAGREMVGPDWVVVATGGARGITAECLRTLAPFGPRLVLLGRSAPPAPEAAETRGLDRAGLRAQYLAAARAAGDKPKPRDIEARVDRHLAERDMSQNLTDLAALGATVEYRAVDVSDADAVGALFDDLYARFGRVDMVVHGAGLIEDTFLEKKTQESFDRVFDTKVDAAFLIARALRPESLKGVCFFTSVAGRYGNRGQTDYAAANETLNRFAWDLARAWPHVTVKAINWGPWGETTTGAGMVTAEVRAQFLSRGIGMVEAVPGRDLFFKEMFWADRAEVESVGWVADGETMEDAVCALPARAGQVPVGAPALLLAKGIRRENGKREVIWRFDPVSAPYVDHHRFDGHSVLPFAAALQMAAELPRIFGLDQPVIAVEKMAMMNGVTLAEGGHDLHFELAPAAEDGGRQVIVRSALAPERTAYRATLHLGDVPPPPNDRRPTAPRPRWDGPASAEVYASWLSHGPRFQTIRSLDAGDAGGLQATLAPTRPEAFVPVSRDAAWEFDPGLVDGLLQMIWIWARKNQGASTLPLHVDEIRRFAARPEAGPLRAEIDVPSGPQDPAVIINMRLFDGAGALLYELSRFHGQSSPRLNRLAGGWQGGRRTEEQAR